MKITVQISDRYDPNGSVYKARCPYDGCDHVIIELDTPCPACKSKNHCDLLSDPSFGEFKISGAHQFIESYDTYACDAIALCCRQRIGVMRVKVDTIFGIEEDERVLNGPWKTY